MTEVHEILRTEFEALKGELISKHDELGMRASGNWANSLQVVATGYKVQILQDGQYADHLEEGRRPGNQPPSEIIEKWIKDKGIASRLENGMSVSSLAFIIARKIARQGWKREKSGGVGLLSKVITPERIQLIIDKAGESLAGSISADLVTYLKSLQ
ncbi:MAG: hypothetical protein EOO45_04260 [Flavobacterium sp.]|nr:MAG: hypothetical protein EOO45_04260 [Flavobacterium sp.]